MDNYGFIHLSNVVTAGRAANFKQPETRLQTVKTGRCDFLIQLFILKTAASQETQSICITFV